MEATERKAAAPCRWMYCLNAASCSLMIGGANLLDYRERHDTKMSMAERLSEALL